MKTQTWTTRLQQPMVHLSALLLCMLLPNSSAWAQKNYYTFSFAIGGAVNAPQGIATDAEGNVYVADTGNNRIVKFGFDPINNSYSFLGKIGNTGYGNSEFENPTSVAVDGSGNIYVADSSNDRIQKFNAAGTYITQFGKYGTGNKQFQYPNGVAVDSSGNVYVADTDNNRIQKFDSNGNYINQFGGPGSGNNQFSRPTGVAVDSSYNIYVADFGNDAVKKFNASEQWVWTVSPQAVGRTNPYGVAVDNYGYVDADTNDGYVVRYDSSGNYIETFVIPGHSPYGIAVDSMGNIFVADADQVIYKYDSVGDLLQELGDNATYDDVLSYPYGVAVDNNAGKIDIDDTNNYRIVQYDLNGDYEGDFSISGKSYGIAVDGSGDIYLSDTNNVIYKTDTVGNYLSTFGGAGFSFPVGVAIDSAGNIYVADDNNDRIQELDPTGNVLGVYGSQGNGPGQFQHPTGVAVDSSGNIYVVDSSNDRIQKFDKTWKFLWKVGSEGSNPGQFENPLGIAVDSNANVYVADTGNYRIQKFDTNGKYITEISPDVWGDAYASQVAGVAVDANDNVYVTDITNSRLVVFNALTSAAPTLTSLSPNYATVGSTIPLTVYGTNFLNGAHIYFGTSKLTTGYVSSTKLQATIPPNLLEATNNVSVTVTNPGGGGTSNGLNFSIVNPMPTLISITPDQVGVGSNGITIKLKGTGFVSNSSVMFGSTTLPSNYISPTQLTATILSTQLTMAEVVNVSVINLPFEGSGGGESNILTFVVGTNPVPTVSSLSPNQVVVGSPATILTVNGANFVNGASIFFNGIKQPNTTFVSDTQLMTTLSANQLATVGEFNVSVNNPKPGGGNSDSLTFTVANPTPVLTSISPSQVTAGASDTPITLTGSGFTTGSQPQWNGANLKNPTYISPTQLTATIQASQLLVAGNFNITVFNPAPGGGTSGSCTFTVLNPVPTLTSMTPTSAKAGSGPITLKVTGSNFVSGSTVSFGGTTLKTSFVSGTQLTATIPASLLKKKGSFAVVVTNPAPGGGDSNPLYFTVD